MSTTVSPMLSNSVLNLLRVPTAMRNQTMQGLSSEHPLLVWKNRFYNARHALEPFYWRYIYFGGWSRWCHRQLIPIIAAAFIVQVTS